LEPLRKQARTLEGNIVLNLHYAIPFTNRAAFESAWPHILKVKNKDARLILVRGSKFFLGDNSKAGVVVHCPPAAQDDKTAERAAPTTGGNGQGGSRGMAYSIELVVDGKIVDLNRIPLPADTPIVDERFTEAPQKGTPWTAVSRNPSRRGYFEKSHSRTSIENQRPTGTGGSPESLELLDYLRLW
jgi:hypothetical protein